MHALDFFKKDLKKSVCVSMCVFVRERERGKEGGRTYLHACEEFKHFKFETTSGEKSWATVFCSRKSHFKKKKSVQFCFCFSVTSILF